MTKHLAIAAIPLLILTTPAFLPTQTAQAPKKRPANTAAKPAAKAAAKPQAKPAPPAAPDISITNSYVAGDKTTTGTVLMHGHRRRVVAEGGIASIQMCDEHRAVQVNSATRVYLDAPDPEPASVPVTPAGEKHKGGRITYTTTVVDTGEKKEMFGFTARHLETTVMKDASPDACDKRPEKVEIEGWYIDLPESVACMAAPPAQREVRIDPKDASCRDAVSYVRPPASKAYPVSYTMVTAAGNDVPVTTTMESTEVTRTTLDPSQFEIPSDYIAVETVAELTMDHRPGEVGTKKPGTLRIGVAPVANTSGQSVSTTDLSRELVESFEDAQADVVALKGRTPADQSDEAKKLACDYVLTNTIAEIKHPGRGVLGKIGGANGEALSAKVEYALVPPGAAKPAFSASEHSGASMMQTAYGAARRVSQYVLPMMMGYGAMRAFSAMSGSATPGLMQQTQDPIVSSVFSLLDRATGSKPQPALTTEDGAVAAALEKEIASVVAELKKKK